LRDRPYTALDFSQPTFYKQIRHPLYFGFLIAFWATPIMTVPHLLFSIMLSAYIFKAIQLEEKDLIFDFKERYLEYQKKVPMLFPIKRN
jgi:protein-S-isoprenylcysteine O-methyltransferase Ste14